MKKRIICIIWMAVICSLILTGCGVDTNTKKGAKLLTKEYENDSSSEGDIILDETLAKGMNPFAYSMYERLVNENESLFFSPYSISMALSMLANAAEGETKEEILSMLGITDLEVWNQQIKCFIESKQSDKTILNTANSIWISNNLNIAEMADEKFFKPVGEYYHSQAFSIDFVLERTIKDVNEWVSDKTNRMIDNIINELNESTAMLLVNAVYFEGEWNKKFTANSTRERIFHGTAGDQTVDMMNQYDDYYRYIDDGSIKGISMPYGDGKIAMNILLPSDEEDKNIHELFMSLDDSEKGALFNKLNHSEKVLLKRLQLPKFEFDYEVTGLDDILKESGMISAFNEIEADFDNVNIDLYVSMVLHKAKIEVDEEGSRAAAATVVKLNDSAAILPESNIEFIVDKPFIFTIQDIESGIILFMGGINDISR